MERRDEPREVAGRPSRGTHTATPASWPATVPPASSNAEIRRARERRTRHSEERQRSSYVGSPSPSLATRTSTNRQPKQWTSAVHPRGPPSGHASRGSSQEGSTAPAAGSRLPSTTTATNAEACVGPNHEALAARSASERTGSHKRGRVLCSCQRPKSRSVCPPFDQHLGSSTTCARAGQSRLCGCCPGCKARG